MKQSFVLRLFYVLSSSYILFSCSKSDCDQVIIKNYGAIQFRRSYANHERMSDYELDSLAATAPEFDLTFNDAKPELKQYLEKFGYSSTSKLLVDKIDTLLKDTISLHQPSGKDYLMFSNLDIKTGETFLIILGKNCRDSFFLDNSLSRPRFRLINFQPENKKFILIFWQYYFMNGDMFNVELLETK